MPERKITYEQALALQRGQAAVRRAARERAVDNTGLTDEQRVAFMRTFSSELLKRRLTSRYCPADDKRAIRAVLTERGEVSR